jgi:hypothetical protein
MNAQLTSLERCREIAGLAPHEIVVGVTPGESHEILLAHYLDDARSATAARVMIVADLRAALRAGAVGKAADLLIVLRRLPFAVQPAPRRTVATTRRARTALRPQARAPVVLSNVTKPAREKNADILPFASR